MTTITRYRGDTHPVAGIAALDGVALDITGCTFILTVDTAKAPTDAANNLFSLTGTITNAATGDIEFPISGIQADQAPGSYFYDIQLIDGAGRKRTIALDKFVIKQDITKG